MSPAENMLPEDALEPGQETDPSRTEDTSPEPDITTAEDSAVDAESSVASHEELAPENESDAHAGGHGLESLVSQHQDGRDRVEALIFSSEEALDEERLAQLLSFSSEQVLDCLRQLNEDYAAQGRAFQLKRLAGGWQLVSRSRYADDIRRLLKVSIRQRLSRAALETLAVIAYKQPLTKAEIESIRGVAADGVLKTLLDRHLVTISGRSKGVGKPLLYATTREFLEYFGLEDLDGMPKLKEIKELMQGRDSGEEGLPLLPLAEVLPGLSEDSDAEPHPAETPTDFSDPEDQDVPDTEIDSDLEDDDDLSDEYMDDDADSDPA
ncbi:MAG: SMC-Scp complex subunit ScpB [Candidatus Cloacimonetes bacterium]|nr:SMC-Scp complex subunit ScpB [Candidatus Cloacimonadota bacterium]